MRKLVRAVVVLTTTALLYVAIPASALVTEPGPCLGYVLDVTPFNDVASDSPHRADIECIAGWDITVNVGTFDPEGSVSRWQMALFLTRTLGLAHGLPSGDPQGFQDVGALPADQQTAINQLAELSITTGVTPTAYDPNGAVTRWQMALFLTRLVDAAGVAVPPAPDQGFTDIAGVSPAGQTAINQLKALGVSAGTSPTTFSPDLVVTREQMASFLARTLVVIWTLSPYFESDVLNCDAVGNDCTGSGSYWSNAAFTLRQGWYYELPYASPVDEQLFNAPDTRVEFRVDGSPVQTIEARRPLSGIVYRHWSADFPAGLSGPHTITIVWYFAGEVVSTDSFSVDFSL